MSDRHGLDRKKLEQTITTAMRMLDNVIDINYYAVPEARNSNLRHRPVGLGLMGFQDALYTLGDIVRIGPGGRVRRSFHGSGRLA